MASSLSFQPPGLVTYDFFCSFQRGLYHLLYLQRRRVPEDADPDEHAIGHAVSHDLVRWEVLPIALRKGPDGAWDDRTLWTMSYVERDGRYWMLYTGLTAGDDRRVQRVGLATSPDLSTWRKYAGNPVIQADPRWYETLPLASLQGRVSWRDPFLYEDPESGWTFAFITARVNQGEPGRRGCVAAARSRDLTSWEVLPPVFAPGKYNDHIVSEVFRHGDRYYLLYSTHHYVGTHYAVSDRLLDGYAEPAGHGLLGAGGRHAWIGRTFLDARGRRLLLHWNYEREGGTDLGQPTFGKLSTPKVVEVASAGRLRLTWWEGIEAYARTTLFEGVPAVVSGEAGGPDARWTALPPPPGADGADGAGGGALRGDRLDGFSLLAFEAQGDDFIFDARLRLERGRAAGLMLRGDAQGHRGYAVLLDADRHALEVRELPFLDLLGARHVAAVVPGSAHELRVVAKEEFLEVYLDGEFLIPLTTYTHRRGAFGLLVEGATATFSGLRARALEGPR